MTLADFDAVIDVKLRAAFFVLHPAYLHMKDHGGGRLVGVTSGAGLQGLAGQANYAAANSGLIGLFRTISLEGKQFGIKAKLLTRVLSSRGLRHHSCTRSRGLTATTSVTNSCLSG
jgi:NAD(P)-dependent dehydrogenase (short-subunit alcohol dehydrogenase family)